MYENYNNQNTNYIPNNLTYDGKSPQAYPVPYAEYNAEGDIIGYYWYYGDTINIVFDIIGELTIEDPEDPSYISVEEYIEGMTAKIQIHNFRYEVVYTEEQKIKENTKEIILSIGRDLSSKLIKGIYYITLTLIDESVQSYIPLMKDKDCTITVK